MFESFMRAFILNVAGSQLVTNFATKYGMRLGAARFVAGATLEEAVAVIEKLNQQGLEATLDNLGESVDDEVLAREAGQRYVRALEAIDQAGVDSGVSVKLTQMGLDIDRGLCLENMHLILAKAVELDIFVRIDIEGSPHTELTVGIYEELAEEYADNIGLALQAYLYRTEEDIERLRPFHPNLRLCKGAYLEPPDIAFPTKKEVDHNFCKLIVQHLENGDYLAVATHDEQIITFTQQYVEEHNIPQDQYEFQMLYGIRQQLQLRLAAEGYTVRTYIPYGNEWYPYFTRRLAERPANVFFVLKNLLKA